MKTTPLIRKNEKPLLCCGDGVRVKTESTSLQNKALGRMHPRMHPILLVPPFYQLHDGQYMHTYMPSSKLR